MTETTPGDSLLTANLDGTQATPRQQDVYEAIVSLTAEKGYSPSVREIGARLGLASPSTVHAHLMQLERAGLVTSEPGMNRTLRVIR